MLKTNSPILKMAQDIHLCYGCLMDPFQSSLALCCQFITTLWRIFTAAYPRLPKSIRVFTKTDKVPSLNELSGHRMILLHAFMPIVLQGLLTSSIGLKGLPTPLAFLLYLHTYQLAARHQGYSFRKLALKVGYFDGDKHERDDFSKDSKMSEKLKWSLVKTAVSRTAMPILVAFDPREVPAKALGSLTWWIWLFINISMYSIFLDFWYYLCHRAAHEVPFLWRFHRTYHTTKHPNIRLTGYADTEQEVWDMFGAPFLAYLTLRAFGIPFDFFTWWICLQYITSTEIAGHSGLRVHYFAPLTFNPLLRYFDAELSIEDHDLHHRYGWRVAKNYGKQTRVWDRLFGTCGDRVEAKDLNIDYDNEVEIPFFV